MNTTVKINLANLVFTLDEDAYYMLDKYLNDLNKRFKNSETKTEEINDIEARIAEIFQQKLSQTKQVVTVEDVDDIIITLGHPNDFADIGQEKERTEPLYEPINEPKRKYKRMYRDPEKRILGGVCSGIGAYLGIDPNIVRAIFALSLVIAGTGVFVYIGLWVLLPEAHSSVQKLEMSGERINVGNIEKKVREEFERVKKSMGF